MNVDSVSLMQSFGLVHWSDLVELACYSALVYYFSRWLAGDTQKNLVIPFYCYCLSLCLSYTMDFFSLHFLLVYLAPIFFMGFILFHQTTLQKNFIAMTKRMHLIKPPSYDWIDEMLQSSLHAINMNKRFLLIIEHNDTIMDCLKADFMIHASLENKMLAFLLDSPHYDDARFIVIDSHGSLKAINARWIQRETGGIIAYDDAQWLANCLELTQKTDALILCIVPEVRLFSVCVQGKLLENITPSSVISLVKNFTQPLLNVKKNTISSLQGVSHESFTQKSTLKQTRA